MKKEIWKTIENYPDYMISNLGNVKSLKFDKERILKQRINKYGYFIIDLSKDGKQKHFYVHRLVATTFLDNPNNYPCVNHRDENKQNNCVENLEFCTIAYNNSYATKPERIGKANKGKKLSQEHKNKIGKAHKNKIVSQQTKEKISKTLKGKKLSQETKEKIGKAKKGKPNVACQKPIACYNKNGDLVALYTSAKQASELLNINHPHISNVCKGKRKSCGGYIFKYIKKVS